MRRIFILYLLIIIAAGCGKNPPEYRNFSGIYPHLAQYNNEGECGTGAVVPWAGKLWVITYGPHLPYGSSDKLYEISPDLSRIIREESVGGTPANRMIHKESNQLFIGPYAVDSTGNVRVIPPFIMPGRHTGNARHLTDPTGKMYYLTMEEGLYEIDVRTLSVRCIYRDGNVKEGETMANPLSKLPGAHGKGSYSGQGVLVYSNNGELTDAAMKQFDAESGSLNEWDGKEWKTIRRNQFVEVTGPGGIYGNTTESDPIWTTGFDHKSLLVGVRENGKWSFYRLPKSSHSYDGAHGWNTEWPRIRNIGSDDEAKYLMTLHGMFWDFPGTFSSTNSAGIRPLSAYLKVIGDFCRWNDSLVFGCDDSAEREFLNERKAKGGILAPGQSNSNLWFTSVNTPAQLGPNTAEGSVWLSDEVKAGEYSEPFLFSGWAKRCAWIANEGKKRVTLTFETDVQGRGEWNLMRKVSVDPGRSVNVEFDGDQKGEWIRISPDVASSLTIHFWYTEPETRPASHEGIFKNISDVSDNGSVAGLLWGLGDNRRKLGLVAGIASDSSFAEGGYYELDSAMNLVRRDDPAMFSLIREKVAIPHNVVTLDSASILITDDKGRRWRLPKGTDRFDLLTEKSLLRVCREVATERDLLNCSGTFYELPAENADGFAKIRPIASHNLRIFDYASFRGMLILTGIRENYTGGDNHIIRSADGKAAVWAGVIDDLWKLGKPEGEGGPWNRAKVTGGIPSDPYLIGFYDKRTLTLRNYSDSEIRITVEADPTGSGKWMKYVDIIMESGGSFSQVLPDAFQARWIRFTSDRDCIASALLKYE